MADISSMLSRLWSLATTIRHDIDPHPEVHDRLVATAVAKSLPGAELCAVYSRPMDVLEFYAVKLGGMIVARCGVWPDREFVDRARRQGVVGAPCGIRARNLHIDEGAKKIADRMSSCLGAQ